MRVKLAAEGDEVVVKRFALLPIYSTTDAYWLEWVYVLKRYVWNWRLRDCQWVPMMTDNKDYDEYVKYKDATGNRYRSASHVPAPDPGEPD